jgi:hypothetical protein
VAVLGRGRRWERMCLVIKCRRACTAASSSACDRSQWRAEWCSNGQELLRMLLRRPGACACLGAQLVQLRCKLGSAVFAPCGRHLRSRRTCRGGAAAKDVGFGQGNKGGNRGRWPLLSSARRAGKPNEWGGGRRSNVGRATERVLSRRTVLG